MTTRTAICCGNLFTLHEKSIIRNIRTLSVAMILNLIEAKPFGGPP